MIHHTEIFTVSLQNIVACFGSHQGPSDFIAFIITSSFSLSGAGETTWGSESSASWPQFGTSPKLGSTRTLSLCTLSESQQLLCYRMPGLSLLHQQWRPTNSLPVGDRTPKFNSQSASSTTPTTNSFESGSLGNRLWGRNAWRWFIGEQSQELSRFWFSCLFSCFFLP